MGLLENISGPRDLDALSNDQLVELSAEIRQFLVTEVSKTGGHLGPNLGVVELTLALALTRDRHLSAADYRIRSAALFIELTGAIEAGNAELATALFDKCRDLDRAQVC